MQQNRFFVRFIYRYQKNRGDKVAQDDKNKFNGILEKYGDMVYSIAVTHLSDKGMAGDISQNVFFKLASRLTGFNNDEHMKHWLIRTAVNECISANRKFMRRNKLRYGSTELYAPDDTLSADMRMVIEGLPQKYREAVILCICDGLTTEEAAEILHRNPNTLRSQIQRAKKILRKELEGII